METQEIDEVFVAAHLQSVLAADERKHSSHSHHERFHLGEERLLQLALAVLVGQFQKICRVLVFDGELRLVADVLRERDVKFV